jgi:3-oxoacyl-[acyl-carrier protein] reductase
MLLTDKNAIVWGGGGAIGGAVARAFAREGARVFLAGRTRATLDRVAEAVRAAGGRAETALVDALDEAQVDAHVDAVKAAAGSVDIAMNVINHGDVQGTPLIDMRPEDLLQPVVNGLRTNFLTSRAAARHMIRQPSGGVILMFGGDGTPPRGYHLGGLQIGLSAIENLRRALASELGGDGVRVVSLQTGGVAESIPPEFEGRDTLAKSLAEATLLGRCATLADVGNVAAFAASDQGRTITASAINISCGAIVT